MEIIKWKTIGIIGIIVFIGILFPINSGGIEIALSFPIIILVNIICSKEISLKGTLAGSIAISIFRMDVIVAITILSYTIFSWLWIGSTKTFKSNLKGIFATNILSIFVIRKIVIYLMYGASIPALTYALIYWAIDSIAFCAMYLVIRKK